MQSIYQINKLLCKHLFCIICKCQNGKIYINQWFLQAYVGKNNSKSNTKYEKISICTRNHKVQITVTVFYSFSISGDVTPSLKTIITENMKSKISILKRTYESAREKILL